MKRRKVNRFLSSGLALAMSLGLVMATSAQASASDILISDAVNMGARITDQSATGVTIKSTWEGFNPIIVRDSDYTLDGANISIASNGDGSVACDFSGYGAAIAAYGDSKLTIQNSNVDVSGVGNLALFADNGADVIIDNSKFHSDGGTLYEGYRNSPDQATMVAPPWILGIMGTSRATNLMGTDSSTTVIDSDMSAAQWAILSTDSGSNMMLNVVNTDMALTGADYPLQADGNFDTDYGTTGMTSNPYTHRSGYGTYTIGQAHENFYGVDMTVGTYANILTGGYATYTSMKAGVPINLLDANGNVLTTYTPSEDKNTTINSDTFGFMIHQNSGLEANELKLLDGTVVNSNYTSILHKTGSSVVANITSGSQLNPKNGILIQAMDNDDTTTGMDMGTFSFLTEHVENAGWPTEGATAAGTETGIYNLSNVDLEGDIFNATGWKSNDNGAQSPIAMTINLEDNSTLTGQISSTAAIHVTKEGSDAVAAAPAGQKASDAWVAYQNTSFDISHYYDIGQVANTIQSNTFNTISVNVKDGSIWNVTGDGILQDVNASSDGIAAASPVTLRVAGTLTLDGQVIDLTPVPETPDQGADDQSLTDAATTEGESTQDETAATTEGESTQDEAAATTEGESTQDEAAATTEGESTQGETAGTTEGETTDTTTEMESVQLTVTSANGPQTLAATGCNVDTDEDGILDAYQVPGSKVTFTQDTTEPAEPTDPGDGGEGGGPGGPGPGPGGPGPGPGGDTGDQTWYTENDKLTLAVLDGVVVAPGTEGATEYTVDRLMYGTADNLSSFAGGGHDPKGDDDYAFITALYVKDGAVQNLTATPVDGGDENPGEDQKPGGDQNPGEDQKPGGDQTSDTGDNQNTNTGNNQNTDTGKNQNSTQTSTNAPKTGDTALPIVIGSIGVLAVAALVVLLVVHKRRIGKQ